MKKGPSVAEETEDDRPMAPRDDEGAGRQDPSPIELLILLLVPGGGGNGLLLLLLLSLLLLRSTSAGRRYGNNGGGTSISLDIAQGRGWSVLLLMRGSSCWIEESIITAIWWKIRGLLLWTRVGLPGMTFSLKSASASLRRRSSAAIVVARGRIRLGSASVSTTTILSLAMADLVSTTV